MLGQIRDVKNILSSKDLAWWRSFIMKNVRNPTALLHHLVYNIKRFLFDIAAQLGLYKHKYNIVFIAGMPMSATTWVKNMFGHVPGYFSRFTPMPKDIHDNCNFSKGAFDYIPTHGYTLFKTHLNPTKRNLDIILNNNIKKIIVTHRDFRDVTIARYHRLKEFPEQPDELYYTDLTKITLEEGINDSIKVVSESLVPWINGWMDVARKSEGLVYFCAFEKMRSNPKNEFKKMLDFYEIDLSDEKINDIIAVTKGTGNMRDNIHKLALQPWALSSNFRSGVIGGWKDEFTDNNKEYFKKLMGKDLIKHGYEKDDNW